jgi:hypothetical protein
LPTPFWIMTKVVVDDVNFWKRGGIEVGLIALWAQTM